MRQGRFLYQEPDPGRRSLFEHRIKMNHDNRRIVNMKLAASECGMLPWDPDRLDTMTPVKKKVRSYKALEEEFQTRSENAYRSGFEDGRVMGQREAGESLAEVLKQLQTAAAGLMDERKQILQRSESMIVGLSSLIAKKIIHHELSLEPSKVQKIVVEAIKAIDLKGNVVIKVHPEDWRLIKTVEEEIKASGHGYDHLDIVEDGSVCKGGCIVSGNTGLFDAQLETQIEEIVHRLLERE